MRYSTQSWKIGSVILIYKRGRENRNLKIIVVGMTCNTVQWGRVVRVAAVARDLKAGQKHRNMPLGNANLGPSPAKMWMRALETTRCIGNDRTRILPTVVGEFAEASGDSPAALSVGDCLTYRQLSQKLNRYARWALGQGVAKGEVICLFMQNRPEYLAIWLGIIQIGGVVSLLNTNLAGASLAHCINVVRPKHIIVATELVDSFTSAQAHIASDAKIWLQGLGDYNFPSLEEQIEKVSGEQLTDVSIQSPCIEDRALCIYTSGTTGLPKAANVNHYRLMYWSHWFAGMMGIQSNDRMYNCLPMYHSVGGVVATGAMLVKGGAVVIRDKFSARQFWDDVVQWDCTLFQYIGELCRYLLQTPPHPREREHRLRLCSGNGLRGDVWNEFKARFQIPQILEFYASTEGNVSMFNCEGKPGAIGRIPAFLSHRFPAVIVKFDVEKDVPVRDEQGSCVQCRPGEIGETIGRISDDPTKYVGRFDGYTDTTQTEQKILRNVFTYGDAWFRTGDLMRRDEQGYFYFIDRVGDTFRWKGENVATYEVSELITQFSGVAEAVVYGVSIPGADGRAGMAAVVVKEGLNLDLAMFREHLVTRLPEYACPLFLRIRDGIEITATFKQIKNDLMREGFDPRSIGDPIYFHDTDRQAFVPLDGVLYDRIRSGQVRL
jgi:fatty-acyl-CoA synthase